MKINDSFFAIGAFMADARLRIGLSFERRVRSFLRVMIFWWDIYLIKGKGPGKIKR